MQVYVISRITEGGYNETPLCVTTPDIQVALSRINGIIDSYNIYDDEYLKPSLEYTNPDALPVHVYCESFTFSIREFGVCTD